MSDLVTLPMSDKLLFDDQHSTKWRRQMTILHGEGGPRFPQAQYRYYAVYFSWKTFVKPQKLCARFGVISV
jgi:hypothetical protein